MMNETVKLILSLSLSGSILAVLIFAVKPFINHKFSKSIQYYIWIVVLLRLILPFSFEASIMNELFYGNQTAVTTTSGGEAQPMDAVDENISDSYLLPNVKENTVNGVNNDTVGYSNYFKQLFNQYILYLWLLGVILVLFVNLTGYIRFLKYLKKGNKPADDEENRILTDLFRGRNNVKLVRNHFVTTPMLIGIIKPYIIIPDINFNEEQLKNILSHEIVHFKRFDIAVKWITMIVTSIHWFNPLMYFIKKEINCACELSCDEAVIKNLSQSDKQAYGDILISIASEYKHSKTVLQITMCEEKRNLKERLVSIMNHNKKSKLIIILSIILFGFVIFAAVYLGAGIGRGKVAPLNLSISTEDGKTKTASIGNYNLTEISKYKTPHVGDSSKVSNMVRHLPVPDNYFKQQYISLLTGNKPYGLNVFYEAKKGASHSSKWPIDNPNDSVIYSNMQKNALVLFCMIDNVDEVTFAFRDSQSTGKLDESQYGTKFTFSRASIQYKYGDISVISKDLASLEDILTGKISKIKENKQEFSAEERKRMDLYVTIMKSAFNIENGGNKFIAVRLDTLKGLSDRAKAEVLKELTGLSPNVYSFEKIKNDNDKFEIDDRGSLGRTIDGTLLYLQVDEYSENKAVITGSSWFSNKGAVFPKYEAAFQNGSWQVKTIGMSIS